MLSTHLLRGLLLVLAARDWQLCIAMDLDSTEHCKYLDTTTTIFFIFRPRACALAAGPGQLLTAFLAGFAGGVCASNLIKAWISSQHSSAVCTVMDVQSMAPCLCMMNQGFMCPPGSETLPSEFKVTPGTSELAAREELRVVVEFTAREKKQLAEKVVVQVQTLMRSRGSVAAGWGSLLGAHSVQGLPCIIRDLSVQGRPDVKCSPGGARCR